jgi:DNA-binding NtrC family response regulator
LEKAVAEGRFRCDLYHRLAQFTLQVPPLRERVADIAPLARYFLAHHDPQLSFTASAIAALEAQPWPGNIRELRNVVTKTALLAPHEEISAGDLAFTVAAHDTGVTAKTGNLESMEKRAIFEALTASGGHQQRAAAQLGISRRTLTRKLKVYRPAAIGARVSA